jgi:hypothetical protein
LGQYSNYVYNPNGYYVCNYWFDFIFDFNCVFVNIPCLNHIQMIFL